MECLAAATGAVRSYVVGAGVEEHADSMIAAPNKPNRRGLPLRQERGRRCKSPERIRDTLSSTVIFRDGRTAAKDQLLWIALQALHGTADIIERAAPFHCERFDLAQARIGEPVHAGGDVRGPLVEVVGKLPDGPSRLPDFDEGTASLLLSRAEKAFRRFQDVIDAIQAIADRNIRRFDLLAGPEEGAELPGEATDAAGLPESQPGIAGRTEEESNLMRLLAETHHGAQ